MRLQLRKRPAPTIPEVIDVQHIPCLYVVTYLGSDGEKRAREVIATSPARARAEVASLEPGEIRIVRTYREGYVEWGTG